MTAALEQAQDISPPQAFSSRTAGAKRPGASLQEDQLGSDNGDCEQESEGTTVHKTEKKMVLEQSKRQEEQEEEQEEQA
jgi:hypothetical protein